MGAIVTGELMQADRITPTQAIALCTLAGFTGALTLRTAVAIMAAESGLERQPEPRDEAGGLPTLYGPWMLPEGANGGITRRGCEHWFASTAAAYDLSLMGKSWGDWPSYTTGTYHQQAGKAAAALADLRAHTGLLAELRAAWFPGAAAWEESPEYAALLLPGGAKYNRNLYGGK
jgi:hypothetical protein